VHGVVPASHDLRYLEQRLASFDAPDRLAVPLARLVDGEDAFVRKDAGEQFGVGGVDGEAVIIGQAAQRKDVFCRWFGAHEACF
jgi:hypothetical protein